MTKTIHWLPIFAIAAILIGSVSVGTIAFADDDDDDKKKGKSLKQLQRTVDSFFDVFFDVDVGATTPDSFFDIFVDVDTGAKPDSFFDIFVELHETDQQIQTEIVALQLSSTDPATASDYFLKIEGIDGESTDADHDKWIDILSFSQGQSVPVESGTGTTRSRGAVVFEDVTVTKVLDKSSPKIAEAVAKGEVIPKVELELTATYGSAGPQTYYAYELKNVLVTSYSISGSSPDVPIDTFSLNFEEIKVTYTEYDDDGSSKGNVEYTWKVEEGES